MEATYKNTLSLINYISDHWSKQTNIDSEEFKSLANELFIDAFQKFDEKKASFKTFFSKHLRLRFYTYVKKMKNQTNGGNMQIFSIDKNIDEKSLHYIIPGDYAHLPLCMSPEAKAYIYVYVNTPEDFPRQKRFMTTNKKINIMYGKNASKKILKELSDLTGLKISNVNQPNISGLAIRSKRIKNG